MFTWIINIFRRNKKDTVTLELQQEGNMAQSVTQQIQQDPSVTILRESQTRINKLKVYANYFDNRTLTDILNQSEVIHDVFENNKELSFKKLEQYHYYYTDHLLELLQKLKTSKDENIAIIASQVKSLENKIANGKKKSNQILQGDIKKLNNDKSQYAQVMSLQLASIYNCMVDNFNDFRFKKRNALTTYTAKNGTELAWSLPSELFLSLTDYKSENQYTWEDYHIERKLMGRLQKHLFLIDFVGVCYSGDSNFEIFKFSDNDDYFIYIHAQGIFKFLEYRRIQDLCTTDNTKYGELCREVDEFEDKKVEIQSRLTEIKKVDSKVAATLKEYLKKIEDIELINTITEVDVERQNLQSILELTRIEI